MKHFFFFIFCALSVPCFAQVSYTDFIQMDTKIQWAVEYNQVLNITPNVKQYRIRQFLLQQLKHNNNFKVNNGYFKIYNIKNDTIVESKFYKTDGFILSQDSVISYENPYHSNGNSYDTNDNSFFITNEKRCSCDGELQDNKFDIYKVLQLIYYKNAKLYTKNVLVTPLCLKETADVGIEELVGEHKKFIWRSHFSACFNNTATEVLSPEIKKNCIDFGNTETMYNFYYGLYKDSLNSKVFTLKNPVFSKHLYEDILSSKITAVDENGNRILPSKIMNYGVEVHEVPVYDSIGMQTGYVKYAPEINIDSIYEYGINQHFYFDTVAHKLYSEINYVDVYRKLFTAMDVYIGKSVYFRIYFIKPALYKKPATKKFITE